MVGNDVVDLVAAVAPPPHPRFDRRVFAPGELDRAGGRRWALWAAKEAAFKIARKIDPAVVFAHSLFEVDLAARTVTHRGRVYAIEIDETPERVHVVATHAPPPGATIARAARVLPEGADPGEEARRLALETLAPLLGPELSIGRDGRIPVLAAAGRPAGHDLSLSHHGRWVAFACETRPDR